MYIYIYYPSNKCRKPLYNSRYNYDNNISVLTGSVLNPVPT